MTFPQIVLLHIFLYWRDHFELNESEDYKALLVFSWCAMFKYIKQQLVSVF